MIRYIKTVLLQIDILINAIFGGYSGETISHRFALMAKQKSPIGCLFCDVIQIVIPNHCDLKKPSKAQSLARPGDDPLKDGV